jgi:hypothetical protein
VVLPLALFALHLGLTSAQIQEGATLTILRGQVALTRPDGSSVQPATSGLTVRVGDRISTLSQGGALITFFTGSEIEMGEETILVIQQINKQGETIDISLQQVLGATLSRVQQLADTGSRVRIDAGGAVALVRGTELLVSGPSKDNISLVVCLHDCDARSSFAGCPLSKNLGYWVEVDNGKVIRKCEPFRPDPSQGYWNSASEAMTTAEQVVAQHEILPSEGEKDEEETATPTRTRTRTRTPTATGTRTPTSTGTSTPTSTSTSTQTPTATSTSTSTSTPTNTSTSTPTNTSTPTPTNTSTPTPTNTSTPTPTNTSTPTPTNTSTPTPTATPVPACEESFSTSGFNIPDPPSPGGGTASVTQVPENGDFRQTVTLALNGAFSNQTFDVYLEQGGGSEASHLLVGSFTTNGSGNGSFSGSILVPDAASLIDIELVFDGESVFTHRYIVKDYQFGPCD